MSLKKIFSKSLDFWIISFIVITSIAYTVYCEIFPTDWFLSKRMYKNNEAFTFKRSFTRLTISSNEKCHFDLFPYQKNPDLLFANTLHDYLGNHHKARVALISLEGKLYIIKKYKCQSFWAWLEQIPIRNSKAYRSWHFAQKLSNLSIPTASPILMIEKKIGPFWTSTYLVREYIDGITAHEFFGEESPHRDSWEEALRAIKKGLKDLDSHQLVHGKISLNNTIIHEGKAYFLDLDLMHQYRLNHEFYKKRVENQHVRRLARMFKKTSHDANKLFSELYSLPRKSTAK